VDKRIDCRLVELPQVPSDRTAAPFPSVLLVLLLLLLLLVLVLGRGMMVQTLGKRDQQTLRGRGGHGNVCCCCCCLLLAAGGR
jgi:hypothetical protein